MAHLPQTFKQKLEALFLQHESKIEDSLQFFPDYNAELSGFSKYGFPSEINQSKIISSMIIPSMRIPIKTIPSKGANYFGKRLDQKNP